MAAFMTAWFFYASLWILRSSILVNCEGEPKFRGVPKKKYTAFLGDSVKLKCPATGTDGPEENRTLVAWFQGKSVIHPSTPPRWLRFLKKNKKHLKIVNVRQGDNGTYRCLASNAFGSAKLTIQLEVEEIRKPGRGKPPKFKQLLKTKKTYKTGETAKLQCHSTGVPDPNVQWFKDGKPYGVEKRTSVGPNGWTLNLRYLNLEDTGDYTCRVSNNVGSINRTFTVIVKARVLKPIIDEPEATRCTVSPGDPVKFDCKATSVGQLVFNWKWTKNNANNSVDLKNSNRFGSKYIGNYTKTHVVSMNQFFFDGFLLIRNVMKEDEGKYTCLVENSHGRAQMSFHLSVKRKDEKRTTSKPTIVATQRKRQTTKRPISTVFVAIVASSIIAAMIFIVIFIMCCRKQRKDLEKEYVNEYQPQDLFQPYVQQTNIYQEMQNDSTFNRPWNDNNAESMGISKDARVSLQTSQNSLGAHSDSKRINEPSSWSEMYLANSRTSLQTTLCRPCTRETSFDYKGGSHSLPRRTGSTSKPGVQTSGILPRGVSSPGVSTSERGDDGRKWDSQISLDDSPRNTSPQRSRESIV